MTAKKKSNKDRAAQVLPQKTKQALVIKAFNWFERKVLNSERVHEDSNVRRRVVLLSVITLIGSFTLLLFGSLAFYQGAFLLGSFDIVFALAFLLNVVDARIRKSYQLNLVVGIVIASCLYILLYMNGGINRTAFVWYFTFPLMASFLLGSKKGAIAMLLMTIPVIALSLFDFNNSFFAQYSTTFEIRFLGAYLLVGVFSYMFEKAGENSRDEVLAVNKNLEKIVAHRTTQLTNLNQELLNEIEQNKHAQLSLAQSEQQYKSLIDLAAVGILIGSPDGHVIEANKCICEIIGAERDYLIGRHISELPFTEESLKREPFRFDLVNAAKVVTRKRDILYPDGSKVTVEMRTVMMPNKTIQAIFTDITERTKAEEDLRASEERFRLVFNTSIDSVNISTVDEGMYVDINEGFTKSLGYTRDDTLGKTSISLNIWKNIDDRDLLVKGLKKHGYVENLETELLSKSGETKTGLVSARILQINKEDLMISITRDITNIKREEKEKIRIEGLLQQAQKMEAVGTLAGGIAHDFNNLLMGIQGRTSLMAIDLQPSALEHIKAIDQHIHSATNLTNQLLGAARGGKYDPKPTDLHELIDSCAVMFGRTRKELTIHTHHSVAKVVALVDRAQIEQVLLNLYVNAWQAMPDGGVLQIESDIVNLDKEQSKPHMVETGPFVKISVTDTGVGMDEETQQQIFDPFFTTKEKGRGTGLGLASAYGIIKNHDGFIMVKSESGRGTTFTFFLPLSEKEPLQENPDESTVVKGAENILLVDDEELIIEVGNAMLQALGYTVTYAQGGEEAIAKIKEIGQEIDLVILDLIMPGIDGGRTFDLIREIYPFMPIILSSGYAIEGQAAEIMARGCNGFMQKPFNLSQLSQKIRNVIDKNV